MPNKQVAISIPEDTQKKLEEFAPENECEVIGFYTRIFMNGLDSPELLKAEIRRLEKILELIWILLGSREQWALTLAESLASTIVRIEDQMNGRRASNNGNTAGAR